MERYDDGTEVKDPYSISISDLMAGVLIIFILSLVSMILVLKILRTSMNNERKF